MLFFLNGAVKLDFADETPIYFGIKILGTNWYTVTFSSKPELRPSFSYFRESTYIKFS